jgi:hypothetical protein
MGKSSSRQARRRRDAISQQQLRTKQNEPLEESQRSRVDHKDSWSIVVLEAVLGFMKQPIFGVLLALALVVLVATSQISITVGVAVVAFWFVAFVWIARSTWVQKFSTAHRSLIIISAALILGVFTWLFDNWAIRLYHDQHAGKLHVINFAPIPIAKGEVPQINLYFENMGDEEVSYTAGYKSVVITGERAKLSILKGFESRAWAEMRSNSAALEGQIEMHLLSGHSNRWATLRAPGISQEDMDLLLLGQAQILTVGYFHYDKPEDKPDLEFCIYWGVGAVVQCNSHSN